MREFLKGLALSAVLATGAQAQTIALSPGLSVERHEGGDVLATIKWRNVMEYGAPTFRRHTFDTADGSVTILHTSIPNVSTDSRDILEALDLPAGVYADPHVLYLPEMESAEIRIIRFVGM